MYYPEYETDLRRISREKGIVCLADFEILKFGGQNALQLFARVEETRSVINCMGCLDKKLSDLVDSISPDIKFSIANAYLYLDGANNFLIERESVNGQEFSTYHQTLSDKRYFYYVNVAFEKLYNFWDRVGDILHESFRLPAVRNVYFGAVIDELANVPTVKENPNYKLLLNFKNGPYKEYLNRVRILIVHDRHKDTYFKFEWISSFMAKDNDSNLEAVSKLQVEKESFPGALKEQLDLANEGYEKMINLISECGPYELDPSLHACPCYCP